MLLDSFLIDVELSYKLAPPTPPPLELKAIDRVEKTQTQSTRKFCPKTPFVSQSPKDFSLLPFSLLKCIAE